MLRDVAVASPLRYAALRYSNVASADPEGRSGQMTPEFAHLIKVACETVYGKRDNITIYGDAYDTEDGIGVRDYIQVNNLAYAHVGTLNYLIDSGKNMSMNCGYGRGYSVKQVLDMVGVAAEHKLPAIMGRRRPGDSEAVYAALNLIRETLG